MAEKIAARKYKSGEPPKTVGLNARALTERVQQQWTEYFWIVAIETAWSKMGKGTMKVALEDADGELIHRWIPYTGQNKNGEPNSGFVLDLMLAVGVSPTIITIIMQEDRVPVDAVFESVMNQRVLCSMEWSQYKGHWYPTVRRFIEKPGRRPEQPAEEEVNLAIHARPVLPKQNKNIRGQALSNNGNTLPKDKQQCESCGAYGARLVRRLEEDHSMLCDDCECPK